MCFGTSAFSHKRAKRRQLNCDKPVTRLLEISSLDTHLTNTYVQRVCLHACGLHGGACVRLTRACLACAQAQRLVSCARPADRSSACIHPRIRPRTLESPDSTHTRTHAAQRSVQCSAACSAAQRSVRRCTALRCAARHGGGRLMLSSSSPVEACVGMRTNNAGDQKRTSQL